MGSNVPVNLGLVPTGPKLGQLYGSFSQPEKSNGHPTNRLSKETMNLRTRGFMETGRNWAPAPTGRYLEDFAATHRQRHMPALQAALDILGASAWRHLNFNKHLLQSLVPLAPRRPARNYPTALLERGRHTPRASQWQRPGASRAQAPKLHIRPRPSPAPRVTAHAQGCKLLSAGFCFSLPTAIWDTGRTQAEKTRNLEKFASKEWWESTGTREAGTHCTITYVMPQTDLKTQLWSAFAQMLLARRLQLSNAGSDWVQRVEGGDSNSLLLADSPNSQAI